MCRRRSAMSTQDDYAPVGRRPVGLDLHFPRHKRDSMDAPEREPVGGNHGPIPDGGREYAAAPEAGAKEPRDQVRRTAGTVGDREGGGGKASLLAQDAQSALEEARNAVWELSGLAKGSGGDRARYDRGIRSFVPLVVRLVIAKSSCRRCARGSSGPVPEEVMVVIVHEPKRRKKAMLRKLSILLLLSAAAVSARVVVRLAPPPVIAETPAPPPGPAYVWTPGYYRWDGAAYAWVPGAWVVAPWPGARWVPAHWVRRHGGWVFVEGHWR